MTRSQGVTDSGASGGFEATEIQGSLAGEGERFQKFSGLPNDKNREPRVKLRDIGLTYTYVKSLNEGSQEPEKQGRLGFRSNSIKNFSGTQIFQGHYKDYEVTEFKRSRIPSK
jgi:hypothetical protein